MKSPNKSDVAPAKRRRLNDATEDDTYGTSVASASLSRPVSPPLSSRKTLDPTALLLQATAATWSFHDVPKQTETPPLSQKPPLSQIADKSVLPSSTGRKKTTDKKDAGATIECIASPVQLTRIRDLAPHQNVDTVQLKDILGDPLIRECWNFNFLFDIDFVMQQFDQDVRDLVKVKIIHGFWRRDDERRIDLLEMAERYPNIDLIGAYLPDSFGTHHSKMLVLFRHDDHAQIIIHTANMIPKDWTNMTQAVWQSPLLPFSTGATVLSEANPIGSGNRFRTDIIRYLQSYEKRLHKLTDQLALYDFSGIRAAFLGSAPSREVVDAANPSSQTSFGWLGLRQILSRVPSRSHKAPKKPPHIVLQVSSIATLGAAPTWLSHLQSVLARSYTSQRTLSMLTPKFNIIFPTAEEVRTSLDGYASGGSIHTKVQSAQQQKQLQYLHPLLCHWKSQRSSALRFPAEVRKQAHRGPAAPHIKTYIRFSDVTHKAIDWALVTSANLSKQAWGDAVNKDGAVRIQSYETGVLVWPELFASPDKDCEISMVPVFGNDVPGVEDAPAKLSGQPQSRSVDDQDEDEETEDEGGGLGSDEETEDEIEQDCQERTLSPKDRGKGKAPQRSTDTRRILVGFRMPYDLPLSPYDETEIPWCATQTYTEPDWKGCAWGGFQAR